MGAEIQGQSRRQRQVTPLRMPILCLPASAMTMICAALRSDPRAHFKPCGQAAFSLIIPQPRPTWPASFSTKRKARHRLCRCARFGRPGRRRKWRAHRHVRRRRKRLCQSRAADQAATQRCENCWARQEPAKPRRCAIKLPLPDWFRVLPNASILARRRASTWKMLSR